MPTYEVELSDGRLVTLDAAAPPSEADVLAAVGSYAPEASTRRKQLAAERQQADLKATIAQSDLAARNQLGAVGDFVANIPANILNIPQAVSKAVGLEPMDQPFNFQAGKPIVPEVLPQTTELTKQVESIMGTTRGGTDIPDATAQAIAGLLKGGEDLGRGITTPEVLLTAGGGAAPGSTRALVNEALRTVFAEQMAAGTPQAYQEFGRATVEGGRANTFRAGTGAMGGSVMLGTMIAPHLRGTELPTLPPRRNAAADAIEAELAKLNPQPPAPPAAAPGLADFEARMAAQLPERLSGNETLLPPKSDTITLQEWQRRMESALQEGDTAAQQVLTESLPEPLRHELDYGQGGEMPATPAQGAEINQPKGGGVSETQGQKETLLTEPSPAAIVAPRRETGPAQAEPVTPPAEPVNRRGAEAQSGKPIKITTVTDELRQYLKSNPAIGKLDADAKREWLREFGVQSHDTGRKLRYTYKLSDGRVVSAESALKVTNPKAYEQIKQFHQQLSTDSARADIFKALPEDVQRQMLNDIPLDEIIQLPNWKSDPYGAVSKFLTREGHLLGGKALSKAGHAKEIVGQALDLAEAEQSKFINARDAAHQWRITNKSDQPLTVLHRNGKFRATIKDSAKEALLRKYGWTESAPSASPRLGGESPKAETPAEPGTRGGAEAQSQEIASQMEQMAASYGQSIRMDGLYNRNGKLVANLKVKKGRLQFLSPQDNRLMGSIPENSVSGFEKVLRDKFYATKNAPSASPRLGGESPKAETPAAATAKVQEHVSEVASGEKQVTLPKTESGKPKPETGPRPAKEIIAEGPVMERADVDHGTRQTQYRLRKVTDAERNARWETYGNTPWVVERRTVKTKEGKPEPGDHEEWVAFATGESRKSAIDDAIADTGFRDAKSIDPLHEQVVAENQVVRDWQKSKSERLTAALRELNWATDEVLRIKEEARKKYNTALKRAKIFDAAKEGKAPQSKVDELRNKIIAEWKPKLDEANRKRDALLETVNAIEAEKLPPKKSILDRAEAAIKQRQEEIKREGRLRALGDPELLLLWTGRGAIKVAKGVRDFAQWSAEMVAEAGDWIKPHLQKLWADAQAMADGTHPTLGLSERGIKLVADENLPAGVRDALNPVYTVITDAAAKERAGQILQGQDPLQAAAQWAQGGFSGLPGKIQVAVAVELHQRLADAYNRAKKRGDEAAAQQVVSAQLELANRDIAKVSDAAQTLQAVKAHYAQWTPAAWLQRYREGLASLGQRRVQQATGRATGKDPVTQTQTVAEGVADQLERTNPQTAQTIRQVWGENNGQPKPPGTLADQLQRQGMNPQQAKATAKKITEFYEQEIGKFRKKHDIPEFDPATERELIARANALDRMPRDSVQRREAAQRLFNWMINRKGWRAWEMPLDFWYANALSGPATHLANVRGNAVNLAAEVALQAVRHPLGIPQIIEALGRALPRAVTEAANIVRTGHDSAGRHGDKFEAPGILERIENPTLSKLVYPWKLPGRFLRAADVGFFYPLQEVKAALLARQAEAKSGVPLYGAKLSNAVRARLGWLPEQSARAEAQARSEGLTPGSSLYKRRVAEILEQQRPPELMTDARDYAFDGTFNNDTYGVLGALGNGLEGVFQATHPALKVFISPFIRVPVNVFNSSLNWTPVGYWRAARAHGYKLLVGKADNTGKLFGREVTDPHAIGDEYARATIGTAGMMLLTGVAMAQATSESPSFTVHGSGPADPERKKLLRDAGWIPNSIQIGNKYYSFADTGFAVPLAVIGGAADDARYRHFSEADGLNRFILAMQGARSVVLDSTWLQGIGQWMNSANRQSVNKPLVGLPQQVIRTASSFVVPNALKQVDQFFDPTKYMANDIKSILMRETPFVRRQLKPDLNIFGEPVSAPASKRFYSKVEGDEITQRLAARNLWPAMPAQGDLTIDEQYELIRVRGPLLRLALAEASADWLTLPKGEAQDKVSQISGAATKQAKKMLGLDDVEKLRKQYEKLK